MEDPDPTLGALHRGEESPILDRAVDDSDLATWARHRATRAAAVAASVAATVGPRVPASRGRALAGGVPVAVVVAGFVAATEPSVVDAALVLAVLVVAPVAATLVPGAPAGTGLALLAAGAPAAAGLLLDPADGRLPAALTLPWVVVTASGALLALARWLGGGRAPREAAPLAACGYLAVGSLWLLADRLAYEPAGFGPPFVQLTAVHFTYAGFVATVLAVRAWARHPGDRVAATAATTIAAAPPLVAVGFIAVGALQIVGALLLTVGTYALAWVTLRRVVPSVRPAGAWLLGLSSVSVLVPMVLAVQWAVGANLGTPALTVPQMAATHGVANAVGFALFGVLGWRLVRWDAPIAEEPTSDVGEGTTP